MDFPDSLMKVVSTTDRERSAVASSVIIQKDFQFFGILSRIIRVTLNIKNHDITIFILQAHKKTINWLLTSYNICCKNPTYIFLIQNFGNFKADFLN